VCLELIRKSRIDYEAKFITAPEFLLKIRDCYSNDHPESKIINEYSSAPMLVIDDPGAEKASEFAIQSLYVLIDRRYREQLPTIVTTNLTLPAIA
jgi:DNA replication protein DnaC